MSCRVNICYCSGTICAFPLFPPLAFAPRWCVLTADIITSAWVTAPSSAGSPTATDGSAFACECVGALPCMYDGTLLHITTYQCWRPPLEDSCLRLRGSTTARCLARSTDQARQPDRPVCNPTLLSTNKLLTVWGKLFSQHLVMYKVAGLHTGQQANGMLLFTVNKTKWENYIFVVFALLPL